jgi:hypothetical protein
MDTSTLLRYRIRSTPLMPCRERVKKNSSLADTSDAVLFRPSSGNSSIHEPARGTHTAMRLQCAFLVTALLVAHCGDNKTISVEPMTTEDAGTDTKESDVQSIEDVAFEPPTLPPPISTDGQSTNTCSVGSTSDCASGYVCVTPLPSCSGKGTCGVSTCNTQKGPLCGCNGQVYETECALRRAGVSAAPAAMCPPVADRFACGAEFCSPLTQYCRHVIRGSGMGTRGCFPFPDVCLPAPDCACIPDASGHACSACRSIGGTVPGLEFDCANSPNTD